MNFSECWFKGVCDKYPEGCTWECTDYETMYHLVLNSELPSNMWKTSKMNAIEDVDAYARLNDIRLGIYDWVVGANNLLIYSKYVGNGKTTWSIRMLLTWFSEVRDLKKAVRGLFINVPLFLLQYKQSIGIPSKEMIELVRRMTYCELVVWDDIGATKFTDFEYSVLLPIIDRRQLAGKSNIFTANGELAELDKRLGPRLASRVIVKSERIEFVDTDVRGLYGRASSTI